MFVTITFVAPNGVIYPRESCHVVVPAQGSVYACLRIQPWKDKEHGQYGLAKHDADDGRPKAAHRLHWGGCGGKFREGTSACKTNGKVRYLNSEDAMAGEEAQGRWCSQGRL